MDAQFSLDTKIKVGIIGFGRMGRFYWEAMRKSGDRQVAARFQKLIIIR